MKINFALIVGSVLFLAFGNAQAQTKPTIKSMPYDSANVPREHNVDFEHIRLEASFIPEQGLIQGTVYHRFRAIRPEVDTIFLDAPGIRIKQILHHGKELKYIARAEGITIQFPTAIKMNMVDSLSIEYAANPRKGLYFIGWNDPTNRARKQIWSQGQGTDNRHWIPMYDEQNDKVTSEMVVTMFKPFNVLSNGKKLSVRDAGNNQVWHYKMSHPHSTYLIMLGIGDYGIETRTTKSGVQENLWYYPDLANRVKPTYLESTEMLDFFEQEIGISFPWENYSQIPVQDFMYGAMENTTATVFGDFFYVDQRSFIDRKYIGVNAHELAHQWFGDMITARSGTHHWLQESFATHYNMLFESKVFGDNHLAQAFRNAQNQALNASKKDLFPVAHSNAGSTRWYPKGASVLFMLRYVVGDEVFRAAIKHYLEENSYQNVNTQDLLDAFQEAAGYSLDWFWEEWILRGGEPIWKVDAQSSPTETTFNLEQFQMNEPYVSLFKMPVTLEVHYTDGTSSSEKVWVSEKLHVFRLKHLPAKKVAYTLFDPGNRILKYIEFTKPFEQLAIQAKSANYMLDRLDAVIGMEETPIDQKRKVLQSIVKEESWYSVRIMALRQLQNDSKSQKLIASLVADKDNQVRNAVVDLYDTIPTWLVKPIETLLRDSSYIIQEEALIQLCKSNPSKTAEYLELTKNEQGNNAHNVRISWLSIAIANGDKSKVDELIDYSSVSFEFNTRRSAFAEMSKLKIFNSNAIENAWNAAQNPNSRLASGGLGYLKTASKNSPAQKLKIAEFLDTQSKDAADWKLELIKKIKE
jgi:aminopeptidase N